MMYRYISIAKNWVFILRSEIEIPKKERKKQKKETRERKKHKKETKEKRNKNYLCEGRRDFVGEHPDTNANEPLQNLNIQLKY
jgi:hypothetical protein